MGNAGTVVVEDDGVELGGTEHLILVQDFAVHTPLVDPLQLFGQPFELHVGTADTGQIASLVIHRLHKGTVVPAHARAVIVVVWVRPETFTRLLGTDIPVGLGVVVTRRTHLPHFEADAVALVDVWLEPRALLGEVVELEGCEITVDVAVEVHLALQGGNHVVRGVDVLGNLVKDILGVHLNATHGLGYLLGRDVLDAHITGVGLFLHGTIAHPECHSDDEHDDNRHSHHYRPCAPPVT